MNNFLKKSESASYIPKQEVSRPQTAPQGQSFYSLKKSQPEDFDGKILKINSLSKAKKQTQSNSAMMKVYYNR